MKISIFHAPGVWVPNARATRLETRNLIYVRQGSVFTSPWRGKMPGRADEGESKIKNDLINKWVPPHPGSAHPLPQGRGEHITPGLITPGVLIHKSAIMLMKISIFHAGR